MLLQVDFFFEDLEGFLEEGMFFEKRVGCQNIFGLITSDGDEFHVGQIFHGDVGHA